MRDFNLQTAILKNILIKCQINDFRYFPNLVANNRDYTIYQNVTYLSKPIGGKFNTSLIFLINARKKLKLRVHVFEVRCHRFSVNGCPAIDLNGQPLWLRLVNKALGISSFLPGP